MSMDLIVTQAEVEIKNVDDEIESVKAEQEQKVNQLNELIRAFDKKIEQLKNSRKRFEIILSISNPDKDLKKVISATAANLSQQQRKDDIEWDIIIKEYKEGISPAELSKKYNVKVATIYQKMSKLKKEEPVIKQAEPVELTVKKTKIKNK